VPIFVGGRKTMMEVLSNEDDALEAALGLGELAGLTINNDADALTYDVRKLWLLCFSFSSCTHCHVHYYLAFPVYIIHEE
jgi:hypothetical protein